MTDANRHTPLHDRLKAMGARMISFAGYDMPVRFTSTIEEHLAVRTQAGIFDVSHMTEFWFEGPEALESVNRLLTNDLHTISDGQMQYTLMCTDSGGVVDDLMAYRFSPQRVLLVMNAACRDQDRDHIQSHLHGEVTFTDRSDTTAQIALQGPASMRILADAAGRSFEHLAFLSFTEDAIADVPCLISRSGYTGEDGVEIYCGNDGALRVFDRLISTGTSHGLLPAGLGARDTLRLEAGMPLYGNELSLNINPLETGLKWAVAFNKPDFVGKSALEKQLREGLSRRLRGFVMTDRNIARHTCRVLDLSCPEDNPIGVVTSGSPAPTLSKNIGLAFLPDGLYKTGMNIGIDIRGSIRVATIVRTPFYRRPR